MGINISVPDHCALRAQDMPRCRGYRVGDQAAGIDFVNPVVETSVLCVIGTWMSAQSRSSNAAELCSGSEDEVRGERQVTRLSTLHSREGPWTSMDLGARCKICCAPSLLDLAPHHRARCLPAFAQSIVRCAHFGARCARAAPCTERPRSCTDRLRWCGSNMCPQSPLNSVTVPAPWVSAETRDA